MNLKYNLLWIENDKDWKDSVEEDIKFMVENNAFQYVCYNCKQEEKGLDYNAYDLILMDLNLDSQPSGDQLIKKIRDNGIYTDVIFYSSGGLKTIKQKAHDLNLEGVYFSGRDSAQFVEKVCKVIETTIRKVQDLNNLRGLVMAEVSELDALMQNILECYFTTPERLDRLHDKVTKNREETLHKSLVNSDPGKCDKQCTLTLRSMNIENIAKIYDSSQKAHAIHDILKTINVDGKFDIVIKKFCQTYTEDIIDVRNNLAHCESKEDNGVNYLRTRKGNVTFSMEDFKRIRRNIGKYNKLFNEILQSLNT